MPALNLKTKFQELPVARKNDILSPYADSQSLTNQISCSFHFVPFIARAQAAIHSHHQSALCSPMSATLRNFTRMLFPKFSYFCHPVLNLSPPLKSHMYICSFSSDNILKGFIIVSFYSEKLGTDTLTILPKVTLHLKRQRRIQLRLFMCLVIILKKKR